MKAKIIVPDLSGAGIKWNSIDGNAEERAAADARIRRNGWFDRDLIGVRNRPDGVGVSTVWERARDVVWDAIALDGANAILDGDRDRIGFAVDRWFSGYD